MDNLTINLNLLTAQIATQNLSTPAVIDESEALPSVDVQMMTFDAAFISLNVFNCKVNGVAITPVTFATTSDAMMAAIAVQLRTMEGVDTAVVTPVSGTSEDDRVITVTADAFTPLSITAPVTTLGATQNHCTVLRTSTAVRIAFYSDPADMISDGYTATDFAYVAAVQFAKKVSLWAVINKTVAEDWSDALDSAIQQVNGGQWFRLCAATVTQGEIEDIEAWCLLHLKVPYFALSDLAILGSGSADLASVFKAASRRLCLLYHAKSTLVPGQEDAIQARLMAEMSASNPGSIQADALVLSGITPDALVTGQKTNAWAKYCNTYADGYGVPGVVMKGIMSDGNWLDIIEGAYCLVIKLGEAWANLKLNTRKLPFNDKGKAMVISAWSQVCDLMKGTDYGFLESYSFYNPPMSSFSAADKAARNAPGFILNAVLTNGIVSVALTVNLSY